MNRDDVRSSYDAAARGYADELFDELERKPLDRHLLNRFAESTAGRGRVLDLGCGPGHVTAYLRAREVDAEGVDLSPQMVNTARMRVPAAPFRIGDIRGLEDADGSVAGIVAFYSIVHFVPADLPAVFREMRRVVAGDGLVLVAFHIGEEVVHVEELFGAPVNLDFQFHDPDVVAAAMTDAGLPIIERVEREPYAGAEHQSRRCYLIGRASRP
jgi:SAM-dependent methyltransferase